MLNMIPPPPPTPALFPQQMEGTLIKLYVYEWEAQDTSGEGKAPPPTLLKKVNLKRIYAKHAFGKNKSINL